MASPQAPVSSTETPSGATSTVTEDQWKGMLSVLTNIYAYRTEDGEDPSKLFQRKVNKRSLPDYYEVIKEPIALSTIKAKVNGKEYQNVREFVRDFALIPHNAQVYNRPDSGAYQDALVIRDRLEAELKELVTQDVITEENAKLPYLGEIPPQEDFAPLNGADGEDDEEEEEEDDEEDDEEEADDSDEDSNKRKRKRGPRPSISNAKRDQSKTETKTKEDDDPEARKKRGRPPRVDTPLEARIKNIVKGMRKTKNSQGELLISHFERLPDKAVMPEYFAEIKNPIAMDVIKKKLKRKKYLSVDQFMKDVELMFENAKSYNTDESEIYMDAVELQKETRAVAEEEKNKPDSEYAMEDGRIPLPDGILHNGELWKVGDWVHIQNANDLTKPVVAQIYRTWQDQDNSKWVNACWYYRPEQTVHRYDRHFYEGEVVKTGQYRDHPIDEVIDRCFVMFFTRYNKGRPRGFPVDKDIYVCESRYNEEKHKLNKIKTWASCLPDEVRDKDYEMDLYDAPKRMKKVPSPIKYLFNEDTQKETDDLPKPVWGAPNAPPKIGAVHCRPRDPKDSPPPEPTPTPPPTPPPPPAPVARENPAALHNASAFVHNRGASVSIGNRAGVVATPSQPHTQSTPTFTPNQSHYPHQSIPPAVASSTHKPAQPLFQSPALGASSSVQTRTMPAVPQYSSTPQPQSYSHQPNPLRSGHLGGYQAPQPVEVYRLPDNANDIIPNDIRRQFQCDDQGRVLFFTTPPAASSLSNRSRLVHSAKYLAWKTRQDGKAGQKVGTAAESTGARQSKRRRYETFDDVGVPMDQEIIKAVRYLEDTMVEQMVNNYARASGQETQDPGQLFEQDMESLQELQREHEDEQKLLEELRNAQYLREHDALTVRGLTSSMNYQP